MKIAERLFDWTTNYYINNKNKIIKDRDNLAVLQELSNGSYKISPYIKSEIIQNNIHCIDIDKQAVSNTKMWLYIKILEDETSMVHQKGRENLSHYSNEITTTFTLPNLSQNIINGNTLIATDYSLNPKENEAIKAFDWESIESLRKAINNGGFDVIVTNPPYISNNSMNKYIPNQLKYFKDNYKVMEKGQTDIYYAFFEKGVKVLKDDGYLGYITSNTYLFNKGALNLRTFLKDTNSVEQIIDFGTNPIFNEVKVPTAITILHKEEKEKKDNLNNNRKNKSFKYVKIEKFNDIEKIVVEFRKNDIELESYYIRKVDIQGLENATWSFNRQSIHDSVTNIKRHKIKLEKICSIQSDLKTGLDKVFVLEKIKIDKDKILVYSRATNQEYWLEKDLLKPLFKCDKIESYCKPNDKYLVLYVYEDSNKSYDEDWLKKQFPRTYEYLKINKNSLLKRKSKTKNFYETDAKIHPLFIEDKIKIISGWASGYGNFTIDTDGKFSYGASTTRKVIFLKDKNYSIYSILGILNSKYLSNYLHTVGQSLGESYYYKSDVLKQIPIPELNSLTKEIYNKLDKLVKERMNTDDNNEQKDLEGKIETLVIELYKK